MPDAPAVSVYDVSFSYGKLKVLGGLSLDIRAGEIFGLLGPNGAGKTTLIRLMVGLLKPKSGAVAVLGKPPARENARLTGYMPQLAALYSELSVRQNIGFFASVYGLKNKKQRAARVDEVIRLVELWDKRNESVHSLSGGMKQRVSLACAIAHSPPVLLLDEPTVGLDPELRCVFWEYFQGLTRAGRTLIISSHTMDDAAHCHRLAFLRQGKVIAVGTPGELRGAAGEGASLEDAFLHFIRLTPACKSAADAMEPHV